ncbi:WD40-repeat-containing domain protein [Mrakia frigida]|uniref:F-box/WD repeat-containing protein n=1 Tax=Mrakia frigida TaxID=29902 RepID=UPI003FCBF2C8
MILEDTPTTHTASSNPSEAPQELERRRKLEQAYRLIRGLTSSELINIQSQIDGLLRRDILSLLPPEVALLVLNYLPSESLLVCGLVSRSWNKLANDQALWRSLCDSASISYYSSLPISTLRRRQAECYLRRSSPRLPQEAGDDEGWGPDEDGDSTARWSAEAGAVLQPWLAGGGGTDVVMSEAPPSTSQQPSFLSFFTPTFTTSSVPTRHSSPASLQSLFTHQSLHNHSFPRPPPPTFLPTSFLNADGFDQETHVPNYKQLYLTSRILSLRPSSSSFHPTLQTLTPHTPSPSALFLVPPQAAYSCTLWKRSWAFVSSRDRTVRIWDLTRGEERVVGLLEGGHDGSVLSLWVGEGVGEGGVRVVSAGSDGRLVVWWVDGRGADGTRRDEDEGLVDSRMETVIEAHGDVSVLCVRSDGIRIVSCSKDRTIRTFDATTFEPLLRMDGHRAAVNAVSLAGGRIVSASGDRTIRIWDASTGEPLAILEAHLRGVASIDFDGRFVISGSSNSQVRLFDLEDATHPGVSFGPDSCLQGGVDTHDVRCICNCGRRGHTDLVRTLQISKDLIVSGSYDKSVLIWDRKTHTLVRELTDGHTQRVFCVAFDQTKIVSVGQDGRLVIHRFDDDLDTSFLKL